jgi:hypothetical protein
MKLRRAQLTEAQRNQVFKILKELHDRCRSTQAFITTVQTFPGLKDFNLEAWKHWNSKPDLHDFYIVSYLQQYWPKKDRVPILADDRLNIRQGELRHLPFRRRVSGEP